MSEEQQDVESYFKDKQTVMISEVAILLDEYAARRRAVDPDHQLNILVAKTIEYTKAFGAVKNAESLRIIRTLLSSAGLSEQELALVCNLQITTAEEAKKLIPTLAAEGRFTDEELTKLLADVHQYTEFQ